MTNVVMIRNEYKSDNFGEAGATVKELLYADPKCNKQPSARMDFVIKSGDRCSVSLSMGTQIGMTELVKHFIKYHRPASLVNQVSNEAEMKAMYKAGLRVSKGKEVLNLPKSLEALKQSGSLMMVVEVN